MLLFNKQLNIGLWVLWLGKKKCSNHNAKWALYLVSLFVTKAIGYVLRVDFWSKATVVGNSSLSPSRIVVAHTFVIIFSF